MKIFLILLLASTSLFALTGKIKNNVYTDRNKFFSLKIDKSWQKKMDDRSDEYDSAINAYDAKGRYVNVTAKSLPLDLLAKYKNKEIEFLKVWIDEILQTMQGIETVETQTLDIPKYGKGYFSLYKLSPATYHGVLVFLHSNKIITVQYLNPINFDLQTVKLDNNSSFTLEMTKTLDQVKKETLQKILSITNDLTLTN